MKLPRWLVVIMLSLSVLGLLVPAAGWWWSTWPERTAHAFVVRFGNSELVAQQGDRSVRDALLGRAQFKG